MDTPAPIAAPLGPGEPPPPAPNPPRPWGFWATVGFLLLIGLALVVVQGFTALALVLRAGHDLREASAVLENNGSILAVGTLAGAPVVMGCCWFCAWLRRSMATGDYLAIKPLPLREAWRWSLRLLLLLLASDALSALLGRPVVPEAMLQAYQTADNLPLLWLAVIVAAPLSEEVFFRGFIFKGFAHSRLGWAGATVLISLMWAVVHAQYDWYGRATIFVTGGLLGWARWRTGSLFAPVLMHALMNLAGTLQVAVQVAYFS